MEFYKINQKYIKNICLTLFVLLLCLGTYKFCYLIAEKYFFDKLFYKKSVAHGYWANNSKLSYEDFGTRAKDIASLSSNNPKILGIYDNNSYKIAIIGDSFVWGEGLKNEQRFAKILSDKLNKIYPTKIISLAKPGWNNLDYQNAYQEMMKYYSPNLIIFSLVANDILINNSDIQNDAVKLCSNQNSTILVTTYGSDINKIASEELTENDQNLSDKLSTKAWQNPINQCILNKTLSVLPKDNSIYFLTENYTDSGVLTELYKNYLSKNNKYIISSSKGKTIPKYEKFWNNNLWKNFTISPTEGHPNKLANQMYADILFYEIINNAKWNFNK